MLDDTSQLIPKGLLHKMIQNFGYIILDVDEKDCDQLLFNKAMTAVTPLSYDTIINHPELQKWMTNEIIMRRLVIELKKEQPNFHWLNFWDKKGKQFKDLVDNPSDWFKPILLYGNSWCLPVFKDIGIPQMILDAAEEVFRFKDRKGRLLSEDAITHDIYVTCLRMCNKLTGYDNEAKEFLSRQDALNALVECLAIKHGIKENNNAKFYS